MKKILLMIILALTVVSANAQLVRANELEKYAAKRYGEKWTDVAQKLVEKITLDKNNALTYVQVIEAPGKTKEQLYVLMNYWYTTTFTDAGCSIMLNDKELGVIIGQGFCGGIATHMGTTNNYSVNIKPVIKTDMKDGKIRVTYSVPAYDVDVLQGGGFFSLRPDWEDGPVHVQQSWAIEQCFPFVSKDTHKRTSSKALVMTYAFSNVIMDKIEEAIKNGVIGNENDNW